MPDREADLYRSPYQLPADGDDLREELVRWAFTYWDGGGGSDLDDSFYFRSPLRITDPGSRGIVTGTDYVAAEGTIYGWDLLGWISDYIFEPPDNIDDYFYPAPDGLYIFGGVYNDWDRTGADLILSYPIVQGSAPAFGNWEPVWNIRTPFTSDRTFPQRRWRQEGKDYWSGFSGYFQEAGSPGVFYDMPGTLNAFPTTTARRSASGGVYHTVQGLPPAVEVSGTQTVFATAAPSDVDYVLFRRDLLADGFTIVSTEVGRVTQSFALEVADDPVPGTNRYNAKLMPTTSIGVGVALNDDDLEFEYIVYVCDEGEADPESNGTTDGCCCWHKTPCDYLRRACSLPLLGGAGTVPGWMRLVPPQVP